MKESLIQRVITFTVINPDVWGHVSADCLKYKCETCVLMVKVDEPDPDGEPFHDETLCQCDEQVNDWHKVGKIQVSEDASDDAILDALREDEYLTEKGRQVCELDDCNGMGEHIDVRDKEGRLILQLEREDDA